MSIGISSTALIVPDREFGFLHEMVVRVSRSMIVIG
jgi:hypothetical protein